MRNLAFSGGATLMHPHGTIAAQLEKGMPMHAMTRREFATVLLGVAAIGTAAPVGAAAPARTAVRPVSLDALRYADLG